MRRTPWHRLASLSCLAIVTAACGQGAPSGAASPSLPMATFRVAGTFPPQDVEGFRVQAELPFTEITRCGQFSCVVPLDVVAPADGDGYPTIVLLGGGPAPFHVRRNAALTAALVERGAVVFIPAYRNSRTGNIDRDAHADIRCAVRYAREHTAEFGGDPDRVIVVGQSYGSIVALHTVVRPAEEPDFCLADGDGTPDAVVGLGATINNVGQRPENTPPLWLAVGTEDLTNMLDMRAYHEALLDAGFDAEYVELEGATHEETFDPTATPEVGDFIFEAAESLDS